MGFLQPVLDLVYIVPIVYMGHDQMVQANQSIQRGTDLMAHVGEKLALRPRFFYRPHRPCVDRYQGQNQQDRYQNNYKQHHNCCGNKAVILFRKRRFVYCNHKVPARIAGEGDKIHQLFAALFVPETELECLAGLKFFFDLPGGQLCSGTGGKLVI